MYRDGVCRVADRYYTKTIEYEDINYQLAQSEDQAAIFDGWSACLNYFDSSLPFQLSFLNHRSRPGSRYSVNIPMQDDDYNSVRCEYVEMLENQIAKSNNGIVRTKLLTFGVNVDDLPTARARLERVEADICGNFKKLGVKCRFPFGAGTAGASSRAAPPRQRLPLPVFMGYDPQNRAFHQRLYRPGQLRLPFQPSVPGGDDLGRRL
ncbi:TraE protein, partial [human gut metagenome]